MYMCFLADIRYVSISSNEMNYETKPLSVCFLLTFLAAQEWQSRRIDQRPVWGEHRAAESSADNGAAAENHREKELPAGREDLQPQQDSAWLKPLAASIATVSLQMHMMGPMERLQVVRIITADQFIYLFFFIYI